MRTAARIAWLFLLAGLALVVLSADRSLAPDVGFGVVLPLLAGCAVGFCVASAVVVSCWVWEK